MHLFTDFGWATALVHMCEVRQSALHFGAEVCMALSEAVIKLKPLRAKLEKHWAKLFRFGAHVRPRRTAVRPRRTAVATVWAAVSNLEGASGGQ